MSKNSIIVFDQINHSLWPGETLALLEKFNINKKEIHKFNFGSKYELYKIITLILKTQN